jgi:LacI family transcriptional regulator
VDAVFAANDSMAVGVLSALREAGVRVPEEVGVAGFDDIPIARYLSPPLTSVHVPIAELGMRAVAALLRAVRGGPRDDAGEARQELLPTQLMIRRSCGYGGADGADEASGGPGGESGSADDGAGEGVRAAAAETGRP